MACSSASCGYSGAVFTAAFYLEGRWYYFKKTAWVMHILCNFAGLYELHVSISGCHVLLQESLAPIAVHVLKSEQFIKFLLSYPVQF